MKTKISVIVPVYNAEDSLFRCVESIVYGKQRDISVLLVDDCSSDNSWEVCQRLSEKYKNVSCIRNEKNCGVSYSRNRGIRETESEYILFVDSDDWVSGTYAAELLEAAERFPDALPICGLHFINHLDNSRRDYLWNPGGESIGQVERERFFELADRFQLQQIWNKIFRRDLVEKKNLHFDELQSMGEDYQFVLDYLEGNRIQTCVVINAPLYFYVRASNNTLMSKFGTTENESAFLRLKKLYSICGAENEKIRTKYTESVEAAKRNYIYQICHATSIDKREKLALIEHLMKDGKASTHYKLQQKQIWKERLARRINLCKGFPRRALWKLQRAKRDRVAAKARASLVNREFSIISQNCIGGVAYHDFGMQFQSPTVNLFFKEPDFVRFANHLEHYMRQDLQMEWGEEYPIGRLDDIYVYFMHYSNCSEAQEAWERRKKRINWDKLLILATDMEGFDDDCYRKWEQIPYPKLLFTVRERKAEDCIVFKKYRSKDCVPDLIPKREFYKDGSLIRMINCMSE